MQKQRILLVNRDFQLRYTGIAVMVGVLSTILTAILILLPLYAFEILTVPKFLPTPVLMIMGFACVLNVFLVAFMGVLLTHRIAGPMYSLVRQFRRIEEGHWYGDLKLRDEDELRYLVRNFNAMVEAINRQTAQDMQKLDSISEALKSAPLDDSKTSSIISDLDLLRLRLKSRLGQEADS